MPAKPILITLLLVLICCSLQSIAQLPDCSTVYLWGEQNNSLHIFNYNPALPVSSTNPVANSIPLTGNGLTVSRPLGTNIYTNTFYCVDPSTGKYKYYNSGTNTWTNTGHLSQANTVSGGNENLAAGGGFIYNLGDNQNVYK